MKCRRSSPLSRSSLFVLCLLFAISGCSSTAPPEGTQPSGSDVGAAESLPSPSTISTPRRSETAASTGGEIKVAPAVSAADATACGALGVDAEILSMLGKATLFSASSGNNTLCSYVTDGQDPVKGSADTVSVAVYRNAAEQHRQTVGMPGAEKVAPSEQLGNEAVWLGKGPTNGVAVLAGTTQIVTGSQFLKNPNASPGRDEHGGLARRILSSM